MGLDPTGITEAIQAGSKLLDDVFNSVFPSPEQKASADAIKLKAATDAAIQQIQAANQINLAQLQVDDDEAKSGNGKWRGAVGWVGAAGFAYQFLVQPLGSWGSSLFHGPMLPVIDNQSLSTLMYGMLGIGAAHVVDNYSKLKLG